MNPAASDAHPPGLLPTNREVAHQIWENLVNQQIGLVERKTEIFRHLTDRNEALEYEVDKLRQEIDESKREVAIFKRIGFQYQRDSESATEEVNVLRQQLADLDGPKNGDPIVLALIDGDGYIFKDELLKRGLDGGREAAQKLNEYIMADINYNQKVQNSSRVQLWTYIFFNLKGLQRTLVGLDICTHKEFEDFTMGFNQANPRFTINNVHSGKEAADAKIREYLRTWSRFPQTLSIYFGGAHDNGYHPTLAELQSDGLLEKIVLLQGYEEVAAEIRTFHLPSFNIHNLFRLDKLPARTLVFKHLSPVSSPAPSPKRSYMEIVEASRPLAPLPRPGQYTPPAVSPSAERRRHPDPDVELHKNNPPPCNTFYLTNRCPKGASCPYSHDYILEPQHYDILKENAKKRPCPAVNSDSPCQWGDDCCWGHKCVSGPQCYHRKIGKCWFKGKTMH